LISITLEKQRFTTSGAAAVVLSHFTPAVNNAFNTTSTQQSTET